MVAKKSSKRGSKGSSKGSKGSSSNSMSLDFTGVENSGGYTIPDGTYTVKIEKVEKQTSNNKPDALIAHLVVSKGKQKGFKFREFMSAGENSLYRIQQFLEGFDISHKDEGKFKLDFDDMEGATAEVKLKAREYNGFTNMNIQSYILDNEDDEDEDEDDDYDEEDEDEDEDDFEDDEDGDVEEQLQDLSKAELKEIAEFLDISSKKVKKATKKPALIELIMEEDEEDIEDAIAELEDEDEDE